MTGVEFLTFADKIGMFADEAGHRTVVSRAYYGAFHTVRDWMLELGFVVPRNDSSHAEISRWLGNCGEPDAQTIGVQLAILRSLRNRADYDLDDPAFGSKNLATMNLTKAKSIVSSVANCNQEPTRSAVVSGIQNYQSKISPRKP